MKKRTKALKIKDCFDAYKCMKINQPPKRSTYKDGSIPTKPTTLTDKNQSEAEVLQECLKWLRKKGCVADRLNVGSGQLGSSGYRTYGIIGAGDIVGILPNGIHFEIECKAGKGGRLSISQQRRQFKVQRNNGLYFVCHGVKELEYLMGLYL